MADPFLDQDPFNLPNKKGGLLSFLDFLDRPGQVVRNTLSGNFQGAARQAGDILGDAVDSFLPGDLIPELSREQDHVSGGDLVGVHEPGIGKTVLDIGVGLLTDPLTYLSFGMAPGAAKAARAAAMAVEGSHGPAFALKTGAEAIRASRAADEAVNAGLHFGIPFTDVSTPVMFGAKGAIDPLSLVKRGVDKALTYAPEAVQDTATEFGKGFRKLIGDTSRIDPEILAAEQAGNALAQASGSASEKGWAAALRGTPKKMREAMFGVVNNTVPGREAGNFEVLAKDTYAADPLADLVPKHNPIESDVARIVPEDDMLQVRPEMMKRDPTSLLDEGVGIEGVAVPKVGPHLDTLTIDPLSARSRWVDPLYADRAAGRTFDQAYPPRPRDARYTSGIDEANRSLDVAGMQPKRTTFGPELPEMKAADPYLGDALPKDPLANVNEMMGGAKSEAGMTKLAEPARATFDTVEGHLGRFADRVEKLEIPPEEKAEIMGRFEKVLPMIQAQYAELAKGKAFYVPPGIDPLRQMPADYVMRKYTGMRDALDIPISGGPSSMRERSLKSAESLVEHMNDPANKGVKLQQDIGIASLERGAQQGPMLKGAHIASQMVGLYADKARGALERTAKLVDETHPSLNAVDPVTMKALPAARRQLDRVEGNKAYRSALDAEGRAFSDPRTRSALNRIVDDIRKSGDSESADFLRAAAFGIGPRGKITSALANINKKWKGTVVYGAVIPRISAITRNLTGGIFQEAAHAEARGDIGRSVKQLVPNFIKAVDDGIEKVTGWRMTTNEFAPLEEALRRGDGTIESAVQGISDPTMRSAFTHGVLDNNFVSAEKLTSAMTDDSAKRWSKEWIKNRGMDLWDMPGVMFKGAEQRMRYGLYKSLLKEGKSEEDAARVVRETFFDYSVSSASNRLARDIIPFFQFQAKAIPTQAKLLSKEPAYGVGLAGLFGGNDQDDPVYPWLQERAHIGIGANEQGDQQYIAGLGLPVEALGAIPNPFTSASVADFGRDVERGIVAQSHPLLKTGYEVVSGRDPYFGNEFNAYGKMPLVGEAGAAGRAYNLATDLGVTAPFDVPARMIDDIIDGDKTLGAKLLDNLTGANVAAVDEDKALQQILTQFLERNPDVASSRNLYSRTDDPETKAILDKLNEVKRRLRAKRKAQEQAEPAATAP